LGDPATIAQTRPQISGFRGEEAASADDPWLGIWLTDAEQKDAAGAVVGRIYPTSPAARADLQDGDRILAVDGKDVASAEQFVDLIGQHKAGDSLELKVLNEGRDQAKMVTVTLARRGDFLADRAEFQDEFPTDSPSFDDPLFGLPEHTIRMEHDRRMAQQHERLEGLMLQVLREVRELKQDVDLLRGGTNQATSDAPSP
jgi:hypothetical protein